MKFMKIGTRPDTFYTEDGTRTISSDVPSDLTIKINNMAYHLHKDPLLPKCGLLQRLVSNRAQDPDDDISLELHDTPGGEEAFEACAKFCYGITINVSARNFVPLFCAAKFLRMTGAFEKGNLVPKLEAFFASCVLKGWKDSIFALETTPKLAEWAENLGVVRKCTDSVVEKILTPPAEVRWSYTYTRHRRGKTRRGAKSPPPRDWWTEDLSALDIDLFKCTLTAVKSSGAFPPQLIGEAIHVYATRKLPDATKTTRFSPSMSSRNPQAILETIVDLIPTEAGSVSLRFLLRLLSAANHLGASPATKEQLLRRSGEQLPEARVSDLLVPAPLQPEEDGNWGLETDTAQTDGRRGRDVELVGVVLESFLRQWRRGRQLGSGGEEESDQRLRSIRKVGRLIDCYVGVLARDRPRVPVEKLVFLASAVPDIGRPLHDELYHAVNTYLKVHPELSKAKKKRLCRVLDCRKLSPEVRAHAVRNERLPLRTVVQVLYFEQERGAQLHARPRAADEKDGSGS